jgi:hypothetical protein
VAISEIAVDQNDAIWINAGYGPGLWCDELQ